MEAELDTTATALILGGVLLLILAEGRGLRRRQGGDTISAHWWVLHRRAPWLHWPLLGSLVWTWYHFAYQGPGR